jgi:UrcA family protein
MYQYCDDTINRAPWRTLTSIVALCATAGVLVWSALPDPAAAGENTDSAVTRSVRIEVHQGDLDSPLAAKRLFDRIEEAALEVCGGSPFSFPDVRRAVRKSDCWRQSVSTAATELHDARLNARLTQRPDMDGAGIARQN